MLPLLLALSPAAHAQDTGDTDEPADTDDTDDVDESPTGPTGTTGPTDTGVFCPDCMGAADAVGDEGGSPCQRGTQAGVLLLLVPVLMSRRRSAEG